MFPERNEGEAQAGSPPEEGLAATAPSVGDEGSPAPGVESATEEAPAVDAVAEPAAESDSPAESTSSLASEAEVASAEPADEVAEAAPDTDADDAVHAEVADETVAESAGTEAAVAVAEEDHADDPHHWDGPSVPFVPHHALLEGMMALAFLTFALIFVAMVPAPLESRANPYLSPAGVLPEWYLMAPFELLHLVPPLPGMLGVGLAVGVLMLWPFIDRHPRRITRRPFVMALSFLILAAILALSIIPYVHTGE